MMTPEPEEIARCLVWRDLPYKDNPNGINEPAVIDDVALIANIAAAIRDAYERAAVVAKRYTNDALVVSYIVDDIRALKGETS